MNTTKQVEVQEHKHRWINGDGRFPYCDQPYFKGNCHAIRVTTEQLVEIEGEWNNYFDLVKTTDAYKDYQLMREAWKTRNRPLMEEIEARVLKRNRLVKNDMGDEVLEPIDPLIKPNYPDPMMPKSHYVVGGI